jgi:flavin-dependent thymidylate synthase
MSELPGMWDETDYTGGDPDERSLADRRLPVRAADAAQYARPAIPEADRGRIRVRLLNATPDPLGSVAALIAQYSGVVIRDLSEVTDDMRLSALDDMGKTVLNGPLESVQFHWQIEGVTRSITHQMVRSRPSFFAQESLRFAVPEGDWAEEIPLPPYLSGTEGNQALGAESDGIEYARNLWDEHMRNSARTYQGLIDCGMPAEEARGVLPHDMPTRIHWVMDLRTLLAEAGKRTCTQAQFPWRLVFAGMATALRKYHGKFYAQEMSSSGGILSGPSHSDAWQFSEIAHRLRPVCFQTGECGFMAKFDRSCKIRQRVEVLGKPGMGIPSDGWDEPRIIQTFYAADHPGSTLTDSEAREMAINDFEWAADPSAARS